MISPTRSLHQSAAQASVAALLTLACMAAGCYAPQQSQADTRGAAPPAKEIPAAKDAPGAKESVRAPVQPTATATTTASEVNPSVRAWSPSATRAAEPMRRPTRMR